MSHLLVTNDFPPKVGGIQSYLWELWRRLPPERVTVLTTRYQGSSAFDQAQVYRVVRSRRRVLLPTPGLVREVRSLAAEVGAGLVVLDPVLPLGLIGPHLGRPYAVVLHGAEVTVPGRLPGLRRALARALAPARHVIAGGTYPATEARRALGPAMPPVTVVAPGVDTDRFRPLDPDDRAAARATWGLPPDGPLVVSVSRLVPRKGMDVLIEAAARLAAGRHRLTVAVAGEGRDRRRLERLIARRRAPVRLLGRLGDEHLPAFYGCGDVFAMLCRSRWGGLEQEGFGIVFLEAAATGVAQVAGSSGGAAEAVEHGRTGLVVDRPRDVGAVVSALAVLLDDADLRVSFG
ncbi:MAG TPA: glycosyltransferase family 4 protein, partial [Acidimicrobiales bacterium]|nr:glycosyltransferase family 4 protein [Acidimicrobiales bacterium]